MPRHAFVCAVFALALAVGGAVFCEELPEFVTTEWTRLPDLPQAVGGQFVGVHKDALLVACGNYWEGSFLAGGVKRWIDTVFVLQPGGERWAEAGKLPVPASYGGSVSTGRGLLCIGGLDADRVYDTVFLLSWNGASLEVSEMPPLPRPTAMGGAALLGDTVYVAAGVQTVDATRADHAFWAFEPHRPEAGWRGIEPWPGPARILPVFTAQAGALYLFSGAQLDPGPDGAPKRTYLNDGYRYEPGAGWKPVEGPPRAVVAAPATAYGPSHVLVFSGDDGANADRVKELGDDHPGFPREVLGYHTITNTWTPMGTMPGSPVTTNAVVWRKSVVIPGGESQPGHRTAEVWSGTPAQNHGGFAALDYWAVALYFCVIVCIGVYFSKRENTTDDYFLGGQRIPWWAAGVSIYGTMLSAITFLAVPATTFSTDWKYCVGNFMIYLVGPLVIYFYLPFFRGLRLTSAYEYLERRFNIAVRLFGSVTFVVFQLVRMGIVLLLPALALSAVTGINLVYAVLAMGVLCTVYTVLGGIEAVVWTDVIQVVVLFGGALLALIIVATSVDGGLSAVISTGYADGKFRVINWGWDYRAPVLWVVVLGRFFEVLIPYTTDQTVIQRYMTTPSEKQAARSIWTAALCSLPSFVIFFGIGTALYVFYKSHPELLDPNIATDQVFPLFIVQQFPAGLGGIVIAGVFAAAMSSLDSSLNSVSAVIVTDFYRRFARSVSESRAMFAARGLTVLMGVFATVTALYLAGNEVKLLWEQYMKVIGILGGVLAGIFALGIFTRRANGPGALVGGAVSAVFVLLVYRAGVISFLLYSSVGFFSCVAVGYAASLLLPVPPKDVTGLSVFARRDAGQSTSHG